MNDCECCLSVGAGAEPCNDCNKDICAKCTRVEFGSRSMSCYFYFCGGMPPYDMVHNLPECCEEELEMVKRDK